MTYIRWLHEIKIGEREQAGDKATSIGELIHAGFAVPRGFCVTAEAYRDTFAAHQTNSRIAARLAKTEVDDPVDLENATDDIRAWIESAPMSDALTGEITTALAELPTPISYAVRASRVIDDVPNPAASGMAQAFLGILGSANILARIHQCWSAPWNSRAIYFRNRKKIAHANVAMAAIVQPLLAADAAGVLFTANPLTGAQDEIQIDATLGLGEAVIAARWKPDHFVVAKNTLTLRAQTIATKTVMELAAPEGGLQTIVVPTEQQNKPCLSDDQVLALAAIGKQVEAHFREPQDIEWCRVGEKFWLVQTRPLKQK